MAYLDILEKKRRVEKVEEYAKKQESWKKAFGQKKPDK